MSRDVDTLIRRVREELRAEGADGAGYSDFFIRDVLSKAQNDLVEIFPLRSIITFQIAGGENSYSISTVSGGTTVENIVRVSYEGVKIEGIGLDTYLTMTGREEGAVRAWTLWGDTFILIGKVADGDEVELYVTRAPNPLTARGDVPETPYYADEALIQYTIAACYRESRDYDRASFHYRIFQNKLEALKRRGVPQGQRDYRVSMRDSYWGPVKERGKQSRSDTNPGGS